VVVFIDELHLSSLDLRVTPVATGRPACHRAMLLKLYVYGYLNEVQSSQRLERKARRNVELVWLTSRLEGFIAAKAPCSITDREAPVRTVSHLRQIDHHRPVRRCRKA